MPWPAVTQRVRYRILALICGCVTINYLDRALLGISVPSLQSELGLTPATVGVLLSAFSWSYFLAQVPSGLLLDRVGVRGVYAASLLGWSLTTVLHAFAVGLRSLMCLRLLLGLMEAPCFPANNYIVALWFPRGERARAVGAYTAAEYVGLSFFSPVLYWVLHVAGWRALFAGAGALGIAYSVLFSRRYRDPDSHPAVSGAELDEIVHGGALGRRPAGSRLSVGVLTAVISRRQIWGLCLGQFAVYSTFIFFLTWFPSYLATARHMSGSQVGWFTALPYIAGFFGILFAGWWSDKLFARSGSLTLARKVPIITGLVLSSVIIAANWVRSDGLVAAILAVAFFAQAMSASAWAVVSEISPPGQLGLVAGLFNASGNLSGIVTPLVIGAIVQATGSFEGALYFVGGVALVGACAWIFVVGPIEPPPASATPS